jgi:hypothetical protein
MMLFLTLKDTNCTGIFPSENLETGCILPERVKNYSHANIILRYLCITYINICACLRMKKNTANFPSKQLKQSHYTINKVFKSCLFGSNPITTNFCLSGSNLLPVFVFIRVWDIREKQPVPAIFYKR